MGVEDRSQEQEIKKWRNPKSPEERRQFFERWYEKKLLEESTVTTEDGSEKTFAVYELEVDAGNKTPREKAFTSFLMLAAEAGYKQVFSPVALTTDRHVHEGDKKQPITEIYFTFEKPTGGKPLATNAEQPTHSENLQEGSKG